MYSSAGLDKCIRLHNFATVKREHFHHAGKFPPLTTWLTPHPLGSYVSHRLGHLLPLLCSFLTAAPSTKPHARVYLCTQLIWVSHASHAGWEQNDVFCLLSYPWCSVIGAQNSESERKVQRCGAGAVGTLGGPCYSYWGQTGLAAGGEGRKGHGHLRTRVCLVRVMRSGWRGK